MDCLYAGAMEWARSVRHPLLVALWVLLPGLLNAHRPGQSHLFLQVRDAGTEGRVEMALVDAATAVGLDRDSDGEVSPAEFAAGADALRAYINERIVLTLDGEEHAIRLGPPRVQTSLIGRYAVGEFVIEGLTTTPTQVGVAYDLLFDQSPEHRGFLIVEHNMHTGEVNTSEAASLVFTPERRVQTLDLRVSQRWGELVRFTEEGVWHIWIGLDHILFLVALLLPSVLVRDGSVWRPTDGFRRAFLNVLRIVTLFTLAHSVTLGLATLGVVRLSPRIVESLIALSIAVAALNNLLQWFPERNGWLVAGFGLFHGFGFASVLGHLGLQEGGLLVPLLGFNLGVELGQVAILLAVFPLLFVCRRTSAYVPVVLRGGSVALALIAAYWSFERIVFGV